LEEAGRRDPHHLTLITTTPNELTQRLHARMPVILQVDDYRTWLEADDPHELLRRCPVDMLQCYPVSTRVNAPKNNAADLIAPAR
jgi:putative SOS response-associated peptidase YedK